MKNKIGKAETATQENRTRPPRLVWMAISLREEGTGLYDPARL
jgi:hypothetical protein